MKKTSGAEEIHTVKPVYSSIHKYKNITKMCVTPQRQVMFAENTYDILKNDRHKQ